MAQQAADLFNSLQLRLIRLDRTRKKIEALYASKKLIKFDVEQIYSGLYLDAFVSFERFVEELFIGLLTGKIAPPNTRVQPLMSFSSTKLAISVVHSNRRFLDWLPYRNTRERADIFFRDGLPFASITNGQDAFLEQLHRIRNALAHRSDHSVDIFVRLVVQQLPLSPTEKKPAGFLRSTFRANPHQTRFEYYLFEMLVIAQKLSR